MEKENKITPMEAPVLDWSTTHDYPGHYVKIIDDAFSADECAALIVLAESDAKWTEAAVYGKGPTQDEVNKEYRNSGRILRFDKAAADKLYQKLLPYVQELVNIERGSEWEGIVGAKGNVSGKWTLAGYVESPLRLINL